MIRPYMVILRPSKKTDTRVVYATVWVKMISNNRQHQYALSLFFCHSQLIHSHLISSSPLWKRFGFLESKSLSFPLSLLVFWLPPEFC